MNNVCNDRVFDDSRIQLCKGLTEGTLTVGLSKAINYLANNLAKLNSTATNATMEEKFHNLIILEYQFIFPLVEYMANLIY